MKKNKIILLPLDTSAYSLKALLPAKSIAKLLGLTVKIVHISDEELSKEELLYKLNLKSVDLVNCIIEHRSGIVEEIILEISQDARYIVMSTHGEGMDLDKLLGSTTGKVIERSEIPVILIRPGKNVQLERGEWHPKKALIPLNGTPGAAQAMEPAIEILSKSMSQLDLLHISIANEPAPTEPGCYTAPYYVDSPQYEWTNWAEEFIRRFSPELNHKSIKLNLYLSKGDPADEILNRAKENNNDIIAMAWHGKITQEHGRILAKVISSVDCPVLLIKIKDRDYRNTAKTVSNVPSRS